MTTHGMLSGTHEWPRTPTCRCGAPWDRWTDSCSRRPATYCPRCDKRIMRRSIRRHTKRMHKADHDDGKENDTSGSN